MVFAFQILGVLVAGLLAGFAHPFQWHWDPSVSFQPQFLTFALSSLGLLIFLAVGSRPSKPLQRFILGICFGVGFFGFVLYWICIALTEFGDISWSIALLVNFVLVLYCSLYFGLWALIAGSEHLKILTPTARVLAWASLWASLEALRQVLFSGFHWGEIGYAFAWVPWLRISASVWGVHGLTFAWVFVLTTLLNADQILKSARALRITALGFGLFIAVILTAKMDHHLREPASIRVGIVQPNISQESKWNPAAADQHLENLVNFTKQLNAEKPDLIAWPETAFPFLVSSTQKQLPISSDTPLIVGAVVREGHINRNSALLIEKDQIESRFDKEHLVPFGEFVPLQSYLPFGKLVANTGNFASGSSDQKILNVGASQLKVGPLICYEDIFSRGSVRLARKGAQLLLNLTNDAWYGKSSAQKQHLAMAVMQVYQTGLPMVRATNNGLSAFINYDNQVLVEPFSEKVISESLTIDRNPRSTFFVLTHPLMEWIWIGLFLAAFLRVGGHPFTSHTRKKRIFFKK